MLRIPTLLLTASLCSFAVENDTQMSQILTLLDEVSEIATKKGMNVDYLPSVVTVIDADSLQASGAQNLSEALDLLPGIQVQISPMGYPMITVRGLKNPNAYLSDKIKLLIDGNGVNTETYGTAYHYMDFPLAMVERIELLRGPGSTIYGAGAFYGAVNVITKSGEGLTANKTYTSLGSYKYALGGATTYTDTGEWKIFADGYYQFSDKQIDIGDESSNPTQPYTNDVFDDFSIGMRAKKGNFELQARYKRNVVGNHYGFEGKLVPYPENDHENAHFFAQISYESALFSDWKVATKAAFNQHELDVTADLYLLSKINSNLQKNMTDFNLTATEGQRYSEHNSERSAEAEVTLLPSVPEGHDLQLTFGARHAWLIKDSFSNNLEDLIYDNWDYIVTHPDYPNFYYNGEPALNHDQTDTLLSHKVSRTNLYASLQELYAITDAIDLTLGVRIDNYSDFGTQPSSRAALVWRANDNMIFKLLYGSGFRAPSWVEAYANPHINFRAGDEDIKPEETHTYEAVAIYKPSMGQKVALNFFYADLKNVIDIEEEFLTETGYRNYDSRHSQGVEMEYFYRADTQHELYLNGTWQETTYILPEYYVEVDMPDVSDYMFKAMHIYRATANLSFGTTFRWYSATNQNEIFTDPYWGDRDTTVPIQRVWDETVTFKASPGSLIRLSVKNIFDDVIRDPSYYYRTENGVIREGRNFLLSYSQSF